MAGRFKCYISSNAAEWLQTCSALFASDMESYNVAHGFGTDALSRPENSGNYFSYIEDSESNTIIQAIVKLAAYPPTIISKILNDSAYSSEQMSDISATLMDSAREKCPAWEFRYARSPVWLLCVINAVFTRFYRDVVGPSNYMSIFCQVFNEIVQDDARKLHLWRQESL